jgi:hypothetical protein
MRTISATFRTIYIKDDGTRTTVAESSPTRSTAAILVADGSQEGYARFAVTVGSDGQLTVPNVPAGLWFLQQDRTYVTIARRAFPDGPISVTETQLIPLTSNAPDLTTVIAARPDLERVSTTTNVTANISNMEPWSSRSLILVTSAQADLYEYLSGFPTGGVTSLSAQFDWNSPVSSRRPGLPDPALGDQTYWYQQRPFAPFQIPNGSATVQQIGRYARLDTLRLLDGQTATVSVPLVEAPQTGNLNLNIRTTQFAALETDIGPSASFVALSVSIFAVPHSVQYPDEPMETERELFFLGAGTRSDLDLATTYGQFLGPPWQEVRQTVFSFARTDSGSQSKIVLREPALPSLAVVIPVLGPPRRPQVNGRDAFAMQTGVGTQPTLTWSQPRIGSPTSYLVRVSESADAWRDGDTIELTAIVDGATSFKIPPGFLRARTYYATITARQAQWDGPARLPLRTGVPLYTADCVTNLFAP